MSTNFAASLESLIAVCKDGEQGFRLAAEEADSTYLKDLFLEYSLQRQRFAAELERDAQTLGEQHPRVQSTAAGAAHRAWMKVRDAITPRDDHKLLAECERGEDIAVHEYRAALEDEMFPASTKDLVSRQYAEICACHARIRELRDEEGRID